jgi:dTDP-glucose 4,6-dehydratase
MIGMSGKEIDIVFTGLRPGEKMHEELLGDGETGTRPFHRLISHVRVAPLAPADLDAEDWMRAALRRSPDEPVSASPSR